MFHGKLDMIRTFWCWKPWKKNSEPHKNLTGFYEKGVEAVDEFQNQ